MKKLTDVVRFNSIKRIMENIRSKIIEHDSFPNKLYKKFKNDIVKPKRKFVCYRNNSDFYVPDLHLFYDSIIQWSDFDWKTKFGDFRFEWLPYFAIRLCGWNFVWYWESPDDSNYRYYEFILNYLYTCDKDVNKTLVRHRWNKLIDGKWQEIDSKVYVKTKKK